MVPGDAKSRPVTENPWRVEEHEPMVQPFLYEASTSYLLT
jgi:hypothetical protein